MSFNITFNTPAEKLSASLPVTDAATKQVTNFHSGIDGYSVTPLVSLEALAKKTGVKQILVKDESYRFGLNAFKALGGSFAIASVLCEKFGLELNENTFFLLTSPEYADKIKDMTFITATDGNHGRGVAWTAMKLGCKACVYMPAGTVSERLENIRKTGAHAEITPWNYDDTVRFAKKTAEENGWCLVQDTAWEGYYDVPLKVMQGYTTLGREIVSQIKENGYSVPTHIFLQAGVGSMAAAAAGYLSDIWSENRPVITVIEPDKADCLYKTAKAADGRLHTVKGALDSMMAGLSCGEPCPIAWDILKETASAFISLSDDYSAFGMRTLGRPENGDRKIVSGESGAVTTGTAVKLMTDPGLKEYRDALGLNENSVILTISTEGDTDKDNYRKILSED